MLNAEENKRTRLSPRTKAYDEVLSVLLSDAKKLTGDDKQEDLFNALCDLSERITNMRDNGPTAATYSGRHYVGLTADGNRSHIQMNTLPTKRNLGDKFVSVFGPFRTEAGALYVADKGVRDTDKVVF